MIYSEALKSTDNQNRVDYIASLQRQGKEPEALEFIIDMMKLKAQLLEDEQYDNEPHYGDWLF